MIMLNVLIPNGMIILKRFSVPTVSLIVRYKGTSPPPKNMVNTMRKKIILSPGTPFFVNAYAPSEVRMRE